MALLVACGGGTDDADGSSGELAAEAREPVFTADVTAEEVDEAKEQMKEELDEEELDKGERAAGGALVDAMGEGDIRHRTLDGIGSEAVVDTRGSLYIRYGNMTLTVGAKDAEGNDTFDPQRARAVGERIIANLDAMSPPPSTGPGRDPSLGA